MINSAAKATRAVTLTTSWRPSVWRPKGFGLGNGSGVRGTPAVETEAGAGNESGGRLTALAHVAAGRNTYPAPRSV